MLGSRPGTGDGERSETDADTDLGALPKARADAAMTVSAPAGAMPVPGAVARDLTEAGHTVAGSVGEGRAVIRIAAARPQVAVADLQPPDISGVEMARALAAPGEVGRADGAGAGAAGQR